MSKTWYPIINNSICVNCGVCVMKCPHNVYDKTKAPSPVVKNPESCIDHCHGCGNRCPVGAITYNEDNTGWVPPKGIKNEKKSFSPMNTNRTQRRRFR